MKNEEESINLSPDLCLFLSFSFYLFKTTPKKGGIIDMTKLRLIVP